MYTHTNTTHNSTSIYDSNSANTRLGLSCFLSGFIFPSSFTSKSLTSGLIKNAMNAPHKNGDNTVRNSLKYAFVVFQLINALIINTLANTTRMAYRQMVRYFVFHENFSLRFLPPASASAMSASCHARSHALPAVFVLPRPLLSSVSPGLPFSSMLPVLSAASGLPSAFPPPIFSSILSFLMFPHNFILSNLRTQHYILSILSKKIIRNPDCIVIHCNFFLYFQVFKACIFNALTPSENFFKKISKKSLHFFFGCV